MSNSPIHDHVVNAAYELHPQVAAKLTPDQLQKIVQLVEAVLASALNIFYPHPPAGA